MHACVYLESSIQKRASFYRAVGHIERRILVLVSVCMRVPSSDG
jgi:hypothetical protein